MKKNFKKTYNAKAIQKGLLQDDGSEKSKLGDKYHYDSEMITNYFIFIAKLTGGFADVVDKMLKRMKEKNEEREKLIQEILKKYEEVGELDEEMLKQANLKKEVIMEAVDGIKSGSSVNLKDVVDNAEKALKTATNLLSGRVDAVLDVKDVVDVAADGKKLLENKKNVQRNRA